MGLDVVMAVVVDMETGMSSEHRDVVDERVWPRYGYMLLVVVVVVLLMLLSWWLSWWWWW